MCGGVEFCFGIGWWLAAETGPVVELYLSVLVDWKPFLERRLEVELEFL